MVGTGFAQAQSPDGTQASTPRHERRGPGGPGGWFRGGPGGVHRGGPFAMLRGLDLTQEQRAQVRQVMQSHRAEQQAVGQKLRAARQAQREAIGAAQFDEQAVRNTSAELAAVSADAAVLRAKVHSEVLAVLTPEQQAKAAELKAQRQQRAQQFRERVRERVKERRQRTAPPAQQ
jgi:protein CpxP